MSKDKNEAVARRIFEKGAFQVGAFKLKLHDKKPDAPLSPFFINLRNKENPKPGPLDESDYDLIANSILRKIKDSRVKFDSIAPIPNAGNPILQAMESVIKNNLEWKKINPRFIKLSKFEESGRRKIIPLDGFRYKKGERVLLVDDLIT